jgi:hypothetical protein
MPVERSGPAVGHSSYDTEGRGEMIKAPISLQDLRRRIYESTWRFWGLYVHVCKRDTLEAAYEMAKQNDGAPGIDGVTFEAIEESGVEKFLEQLRDERVSHPYRPMRNRRKAIPKDGGSTRVLSIPAIRDRVVHIINSDSARLGAVLSSGSREPMLWIREGLGGEEGEATSDACTETAWLRLEKVE